MNRKLHNTVMALIASSSLFVIGLLTASPPRSPVAADAVATTFVADQAVAAEAVNREATPDQTSPRRQIRRPRQQSVAMPFFSFAPRG